MTDSAYSDDLKRSIDDLKGRVSRRQALMTGAGILGSAAALSSPAFGGLAAARVLEPKKKKHHKGTLPVKQIEEILQTQGMVSKGVLSLMLFRTDIDLVGPDGVHWSPYFQSMHEFFFESIGRNLAIMNCDITFTEAETQKALDAILRNGFIIQAMHQHFVGERPQTWHYHFRKIGNPITIAHEIVNVIKSTSTPFPQSSSSNPTTPLPKDRMAKIIGGTADVREGGVVEITVDRRNTEVLSGVRISPELNVASTVTFMPLNSSGTEAIIGPDLSMTAQEVEPTLIRSRRLGFDVHCLYNQETDEYPQLYFSHLLKHGNPITLSTEIRAVLNETNVEGSPRRRDGDRDRD